MTTDLISLRTTYAKQILAEAGVDDPRLEEAFATVKREDFVGPGPWQIMRFVGGYYTTPSNDPLYLYQDRLVALDASKGLNNGQPSFLVYLISLGAIQAGEHVVHIGSGVGYYTAMMAELAGPSGRVTAIEYEQDLAERAKTNLSGYDFATVIHGNGISVDLDPADVILVNAGASRPADTWLDALKPGGRLILPLTVTYEMDNGLTMTKGGIFLISRDGEREEYVASYKSPTQIYPCAGMREAESEAALVEAFEAGGMEKVTRLTRGSDVPDMDCWVKGPDWALI